ncbi:MAG TPA: glycosyltransferase [Geminicoccus sp.]|uniref:glycosyltransferase family protein n=1 Tax=Geminicoccus sp. TaxID=2024832 RepID=UPI002CBE6E33|nr:glycosyltransferase [Geminicoccus sp.]HWL70778.1 glycosyltransferase [Geminicoccus sp.]
MTEHARLLIYSHDSFGLGHLRRCRTIAHHLVERFKDLSVLILSGSPIIGSFDFKTRVDFIRIPGVIKLRNGDYTPLGLHIDLEKTLEMRRSIIEHAAAIFDPDVFLVDKEPLGLRGEVEHTLRLLKERGTRLVLGLRDVMDDPASLEEEWRRKNVLPALRSLYDEIWVYGTPEMSDPLGQHHDWAGLAAKTRFTGYLRRHVSETAGLEPAIELPDRPYILVTTGGGGDGEELIDWVLSAYEADPGLPHPAVVLLGPFMHRERRAAFLERAQHLPDVTMLTFAARTEPLFDRALGVVAMGGYNTFCEILSFGKPALVVPRTRPRLEQAIRAERAEQLGLLRMLPDDGRRDPATMAACLHALPGWPAPGGARISGMLDGLPQIEEFMRPWLERDPIVHSLTARRSA